MNPVEPPKVARFAPDVPSGAALIYLDQNHVSNFAKLKLKRTSETKVATYYRLLLDAIKGEKVSVLFSRAHIVETVSHADSAFREAICEVLEELTKGVCILPWESIIVAEIIHQLDCLLVCDPGQGIRFTGRFFDSVVPDEHATVLNVLTRIAHGRVTMAHILEAIADVTDQDYDDGMRNTSLAFRLGARQMTLDRMNRKPTARQLRDYLYKRGTDDLVLGFINVAAKRNALSPDIVAAALQRPLEAKLPSLWVWTELTIRSVIESWTRKSSRSDFDDIVHGLAIPYVDWFVTDRHFADLAKPVGSAYDCRVVSSFGALTCIQ